MRLTDLIARHLFRPPYRYLPALIFTLLALCFAYDPFSAVHTFDIGDTDNYMRLNEVLNWLSGQSWHDLSQPRLSPGENVVLYWSRLVDLPIAALTAPLMQLTTPRQAALLASLIVPPILLALMMLPVVTRIARPLVRGNRAALSALLFLFALPVIAQFVPGRVDHHGYQLAITGFCFLSLSRILFCKRGWIAALLAGIASACSLWIGAEGLLGLSLFITSLAAIAAWHGGRAQKNAALYGVTLALTAALILPLARKPEEFHLLELGWFSSAYVILAGLSAAVLLLNWMLGRHTNKRCLRLALLAALGFAASMALFALVPDAIKGPYANLETSSASIILNNVNEAQPLFKTLFSGNVRDHVAAIIAILSLPLAALITSLWNCFTARGRRCLVWGALAFTLTAVISLTLFWQTRVYNYVSLFTLPALSWLLWRWWDIIARTMQGRPRFWAELFAFAMLGLIPTVLLPAISEGKKFYPDMMFFPMAAGKTNCDMGIIAEYLDEAANINGHTSTIMNMINDGPQLLLRTPHNVISAPYNVHGNQDALDFFAAREDTRAIDILRSRKADYVLLCKNISSFYAALNRDKAMESGVEMDKNGKITLKHDEKTPTMVEKLLTERAPDWLKPVVVMFNKDYLLFEVQLPQDQAH